MSKTRGWRFLPVALLVGMSGLYMLVDAGKSKYNEHKLNTLGKTATVIRIVPDTRSGSSDEDGKPFTLRLIVPMGVEAKLVQHEEVTVDYLPDDTSVTRWAGEKSHALLDALVGLALWVFGALLLRFFAR